MKWTPRKTIVPVCTLVAAGAAAQLRGGKDLPAAALIIERDGDEEGFAVLAELQLFGRLGGVDVSENGLGPVVVGVRRETQAAGVFDGRLDEAPRGGRRDL